MEDMIVCMLKKSCFFNRQGSCKDQHSDTAIGIAVSADGTFQKRGSGRCYNSLSGKEMISMKFGISNERHLDYHGYMMNIDIGSLYIPKLCAFEFLNSGDLLQLVFVRHRASFIVCRPLTIEHF